MLVLNRVALRYRTSTLRETTDDDDLQGGVNHGEEHRGNSPVKVTEPED